MQRQVVGAVVAAALLAGFGTSAHAAPLTLTGNFVEVGISDYGTFGSDGSTAPGMLHDPTGTGNFAPGGIPNDYLTPGTPHQGFGVSYTLPTGAPVSFAGNDNDGAGGAFGFHSPTLLTGAAAMGFANAATWSGSNGTLDITNSYFFNPNDQRVLVNTTIHADVDVTNLAFVTSVDPDPDVNLHDDFNTINTRGNAIFAPSEFVGSAGEVSGLFLGIVNNNGATLTHNTEIAAACCSTQLPSTVLAGGGPTFPATNDCDCGLNMAWLIGSLASGHDVTISYFYVFGNNIDTGGGPGGPVPAPEPATLSLVGLGLAAARYVKRRKNG
jgi:hypothetical protein